MLMNSGGVQVHPGDKLLLTGMGGGGVAIRELTVRGIFHFKEAPTPQLSLVSIVDIQDLRALLGYTVGAEQEKAAAAGRRRWPSPPMRTPCSAAPAPVGPPR